MIRAASFAFWTVFFVAALACGAYWAHRAGVIPEQPIAAEVKIDLHGPKQTIAGQEFYFHVEVTGEHGPVDWQLVPEEVGALTPSPDKLKARFQSMTPGVFSVSVVVGGKAMQADQAHLEFENVEVSERPIVEDQAQQKQAPPPPLPPVPTIADLVLQAYHDVASETKSVEAATVVGCMRSLAGRLKSGQVAHDVDVGAELADHVELALGERGGAWGLFIAEIGAILHELRLQGDITTAASAAPALIEAADALASVAAR